MCLHIVPFPTLSGFDRQYSEVTPRYLATCKLFQLEALLPRRAIQRSEFLSYVCFVLMRGSESNHHRCQLGIASVPCTPYYTGRMSSMRSTPHMVLKFQKNRNLNHFLNPLSQAFSFVSQAHVKNLQKNKCQQPKFK